MGGISPKCGLLGQKKLRKAIVIRRSDSRRKSFIGVVVRPRGRPGTTLLGERREPSSWDGFAAHAKQQRKSWISGPAPATDLGETSYPLCFMVCVPCGVWLAPGWPRTGPKHKSNQRFPIRPRPATQDLVEPLCSFVSAVCAVTGGACCGYVSRVCAVSSAAAVRLHSGGMCG